MTANTQIVTLVADASNPSSPWQVVDAQKKSLKSFTVQGDAISWLLGEGYEWVTDTQKPQQWVKEIAR